MYGCVIGEIYFVQMIEQQSDKSELPSVVVLCVCVFVCFIIELKLSVPPCAVY